MDYCPSWTLWHSVWGWDVNIHVIFVHCMHWLNHSHLINRDCLGTRHSIETWIDFWKLVNGFGYRSNISMTHQQPNRDMQCTKSICMFMAHRQTECHKGPQGTIVHDEHHVFKALSPYERTAWHTHTRPTNGHPHSWHHKQSPTHIYSTSISYSLRWYHSNWHSIISVPMPWCPLVTPIFSFLSLSSILSPFSTSSVTFRWGLCPQNPNITATQMISICFLSFMLQFLFPL